MHLTGSIFPEALKKSRCLLEMESFLCSMTAAISNVQCIKLSFPHLGLSDPPGSNDFSGDCNDIKYKCGGCQSVSGQILSLLAAAVPNLQQLCLAGDCVDITLESLVANAPNSPVLRSRLSWYPSKHCKALVCCCQTSAI